MTSAQHVVEESTANLLAMVGAVLQGDPRQSRSAFHELMTATATNADLVAAASVGLIHTLVLALAEETGETPEQVLARLASTPIWDHLRRPGRRPPAP